MPGGSFFFTVVTERRAVILGDDLARDCLRAAFRDCLQRWPFRVDALVMLRDHLHAIWTLPSDDADYSKRWGTIKKHFTQSWLAAGGGEQPCTDSCRRYRRRGIWQQRFWEHTLRDERDYTRHLDYLHYNLRKAEPWTGSAGWESGHNLRKAEPWTGSAGWETGHDLGSVRWRTALSNITFGYHIRRIAYRHPPYDWLRLARWNGGLDAGLSAVSGAGGHVFLYGEWGVGSIRAKIYGSICANTYPMN